MGEAPSGRPAAQAGKPKTRTQRRALAAVVVGCVLGVVLAMLWAPSEHSWRTASPTPPQGAPNAAAGAAVPVPLGVERRAFGLLRYAIWTRTDVPAGAPPAPESTTSLDWRWPPFLATLFLSAVSAGVAIIVYRRLMTIGVVPGYCRNCAYSLAGLESGRCPECGEVNPAPSAPMSA